MIRTRTHSGTAGTRRAAPGLALVVAVAGPMVVLSGCSWVPEWANPVSWYDSVASNDPPPPQPATEADRNALAKRESRDKSFPSLASVPDRAPATSTAAERRDVAQGLVADRANARYTDEGTATAAASPAVPPPPVPRQTAAMVTPPPPPAPVPVPAPRAAAPVPPPMSPLPSIVQGGPRPAPVSTRSATVPPPTPAPVPSLVQSAPQRVAAATPRTVPPPVPTGIPAPAPIAAAPQPAPLAPAAPAPSLAPQRLPSPQFAPQVAQQAAPQVAALPAPGQPVTVAQVFAQRMAESAATVSTLPVHAGYSGVGATPSYGPTPTLTPPGGQTPAQSFQTALATDQRIRLTPPAGTGAASGAEFSAAAGRLRLGPTPGTPVMIRFANGSSAVDREAAADLRSVAEAFRARGGTVRVVGHASSRTRNLPIEKHKLVNLWVSMDRAQAVVRELVRLGVPATAIVTEAKSDGDPLYFEAMPAGEAQNRRAEVYLE